MKEYKFMNRRFSSEIPWIKRKYPLKNVRKGVLKKLILQSKLTTEKNLCSQLFFTVISCKFQILESSTSQKNKTCFKLLPFGHLSQMFLLNLIPPRSRERGENSSLMPRFFPLELLDSLAANKKFPRGALKGDNSEPEAWDKYPVSQATSPTPFWARHSVERS